MKKFYSISIPKPCHEDWNSMTPNEKGRFCNSCTKTVIDFTKMNSTQIQEFINDNKNNRICGHFNKNQLDTINIRIPSRIIFQRQSFHKIFLLALLISMGTSLMNCTNKNGDKQKIDSIEVIDTLNNIVINSSNSQTKIVEDSTQIKTCKNPSIKQSNNITTEGELVIETLGIVEFAEKIDSLTNNYDEKELEIMGDLSFEDEAEDFILGLVIVETPPQFYDTPENLTNKEKKEYFSKQVSKIISENFDKSVYLDSKGKIKLHTQFKIDSLGFVNNIRVRAPHPKLEEEAKRVIKLLPKFIPANHNGKPVDMIYNLPIIFQIEE